MGLHPDNAAWSYSCGGEAVLHFRPFCYPDRQDALALFLSTKLGVLGRSPDRAQATMVRILIPIFS